MSGAVGRRPGIPGIQLARSYQRSWLRPDLLAAVTVWALLVPQALAYAQLAKVDPVVGLYATIGAAIGYVLLGGVRSMTVGPEGTIALLTATILAPMAAGDPTRYLALAGGLALVASGWLFLSGLIGLGFVTRWYRSGHPHPEPPGAADHERVGAPLGIERRLLVDDAVGFHPVGDDRWVREVAALSSGSSLRR